MARVIGQCIYTRKSAMKHGRRFKALALIALPGLLLLAAYPRTAAVVARQNPSGANVRIAEGQRLIHDLLKTDSLYQRTVPARQGEVERRTRYHDAARYQRASPHAGELPRRIFDRRNNGVSRRNPEQTIRADRN